MTVNTVMTMSGATETGHSTDLLLHLFLSGIQWYKWISILVSLLLVRSFILPPKQQES